MLQFRLVSETFPEMSNEERSFGAAIGRKRVVIHLGANVFYDLDGTVVFRATCKDGQKQNGKKG